MSSISYRHPAREQARRARIGVRGLAPVQQQSAAPVRDVIVLRAGESVMLTGPNAGRVTSR